jgi:hypothetical protein
MSDTTRLASRIYTVAALVGIAMLAPLYFMEARVAELSPPAVTHPEHYYGFVGLALVWQFAFLLIARDPIRYRPLMPITFLEKLAFGGAVVWLSLAGRVDTLTLGAGLADLTWLVLFVVAWRRTPPEETA